MKKVLLVIMLPLFVGISLAQEEESDMAGSHSEGDMAGSQSEGEMEADAEAKPEAAAGSEANQSVEPSLAGATIYTCPMHPQIRQPGEGRCPICGMELVPAAEDSGGGGLDDGTIKINPVARRLAGIKTMMVEPKPLEKTIRAVGSVEFDESRLATIPAYVDGRIEKLYADYTGVEVKEGDHLAVVYSPNLYTAQVEYLQARRSARRLNRSTVSSVRQTQQELLAGARTKLIELGMSEKQIDRITRTGKAESRLEIYSPIAGTVIAKPAAQGQYLKAGQTIFRIADLSTVWLVIDVFPEDAAYIHYGQKVRAQVRSVSGRTIEGRVAFIEPVVNPKTRTIGVRVEIVNPTGELRPGDYADAELTVPVTTKRGGGKVFDPSLVGKWISPMHPQIISDEPGKCPICGMDMVKAETYGFVADPDEQEELISVPRDALLRVGKTSVVFVEESEGEFTLRRVRTGPTANNEVVILEGLDEYETIASSGVFLLDSQLQLSGKTSLIDTVSFEQEEAEKAKAESSEKPSEESSEEE